MNELLQNLIRLQSLEFGEIKEKNADSAITELRGKIPPQIIAHYDRLVARGKKGVAAVRNQVCTGCHMRVPIGVVTTLMHDKDIQICESCGRYLYLSDAPQQTTPVPVGPKAKATRKPRQRRNTAPAPSIPHPTVSLAVSKPLPVKMHSGLRPAMSSPSV